VGPAIVIVRVVCPSVCLSHAKLIEIDVWLLGNTNSNRGFSIQNLVSDLRPEVQFRQFERLLVVASPTETDVLNTVSSAEYWEPSSVCASFG